MKKQLNVLCLFDYHSFTGFATVSQNLLAQWRKQLGAAAHFDIVAINYFGNAYTEEDGTRVISAKMSDGQKDDFGRYTFLKTLSDIDYNMVFILQDLGVVVSMIPHMQRIKENKRLENRRNFKSIFYFPVDCALTHNLCKGLEFFDMLATYTEFGRKEVLTVRPDLKGKVQVIPHGINQTDFNPLPKDVRDKFRHDYFGVDNSKTIVLNVNRNQPRKDIPATIFGFMEYHANYNPNSILYLHMNPRDLLGWDLIRLLSQTPLKIGEDVMFPPQDDYTNGASVEKLNNIYNACDVFVTTATGGGWELTVTEAMATGIPVIMPMHTSFAELGGDDGKRCYFLEELTPVVHNTDNIIRFQSNLYELAEKINSVVKADHYVKKLEGWKFVDTLKWYDIAKRFSDAMVKLG